MSFDRMPLSVRKAAAQAAAHSHPAPHAEFRLSWLRFVVYLIQHDRRFDEWPARERVS